jgi:conjugative relaxase-like TrwC/TraI family protein
MLRPGHEAYYLGVAPPPGSGIEGSEAPGFWVGGGAHLLGLAGSVDELSLGALLRSRHPGSGEVLNPSADRIRRAGFDLTFAAPKSVSLLHGLGSGEVTSAVAGAHTVAVLAAFDYLERRGVAVRRTIGGERRTVASEGAVASAFLHRTSRALDPHLHTHVVLANLAAGEDGRYTALDSRGIFAHKAAAAAIYHAQLRFELTGTLGVEWGPLSRGRADVKGVEVEVRRAFSQRAAAIARDLVDHDLGGQRARDIASAATRPARDPEARFEDLRPGWREHAASLGFDGPALEAVLGRSRAPSRAPAAEPLQPAQYHRAAEPLQATYSNLVEAAVPAALRTLGERPLVARRDVVREIAASLHSGGPAKSIEAAADLMVPGGRGPGVSEPRVPGTELEAPGWATRRLGARPGPGQEWKRDRWDRAADALADFRARWGEGSRQPTIAESAERMELQREVRLARALLEHSPTRGVERSRCADRSAGLGL